MYPILDGEWELEGKIVKAMGGGMGEERETKNQ
jgi:hypothetical protein